VSKLFANMPISAYRESDLPAHPTKTPDHQHDDDLLDSLSTMTDDLEAAVGGMVSGLAADVPHMLDETVADMRDVAAGRLANPRRHTVPPSVVALGRQASVQQVVAQRVPRTARSMPPATQSGFSTLVAFVRRQLGLDD